MYISPSHAVPPNEKSILAPWILVGQLADGLVDCGHNVTLFAAKESKTTAKLVHGGIASTVGRRSNYTEKEDYRAYVIAQELALMREVIGFAKAGKLDVVHIHQPVERLYPALLAMPAGIPVVVTFHDPITPERFAALEKLMELGNIHLVSLSRSQQAGVPFPFAGVVPNGVDTKLFKPDAICAEVDMPRFSHRQSPDQYLSMQAKVPRPSDGASNRHTSSRSMQNAPLLITGRIVPQKGFVDAIAAARLVGTRLLIVGQEYGEKKEARIYFENEIKPAIDGSSVIWESVVKQEHLVGHYQTAKALLFPIHWEEPFGLVMIEAMACGTPVVAYNRGSVPEIIVDGKTGFIVDHALGIPGLVAAIKRIGEIDRKVCRAHVEKHFSLAAMTSGYEHIYKQIARAKI